MNAADLETAMPPVAMSELISQARVVLRQVVTRRAQIPPRIERLLIASPRKTYAILGNELDALLECGGAPPPDYRVRLINIAAIAIAAVQSWDHRNVSGESGEVINPNIGSPS
jgi:hypothetical protein